MFNWKVRIQHIADLIQENNIDIIAFQEVRIAGTATKPVNSYWYGWDKEGLGILSRKQIVSSTTVNLTNIGQIDTNPRIALHVHIRLDTLSSLHVIVVHFSYDRNQQCKNAEELMNYISNQALSNVVILGDFNVYTDFPRPIDIFISKRQSSCFIKSDTSSSFSLGSFKDAWISFDKHGTGGFTFSNMPEPGLVSRPDRILISKNITVDQAKIIGDGLEFKNHLYFSILLSRVKSMIQSSFDAFVGKSGYSCLHDCGPHGSCRCGICIRGGNQLNCNTPDCNECSSLTFLLLSSALILLSITLATLFYSIIKILVVSSRFNQQDFWDILGYRCCLFNKELFLSLSIMPRRYKSKISKNIFVFIYCLLKSSTSLKSCLTFKITFTFSGFTIYFVTKTSITKKLKQKCGELPEEYRNKL
ncbi:hypothetical protein Btru_057770 [Bulinus truncatus]|nr:hypothetical protein Btru_057770 [Bulinus truncatus]